MLFNSLIFLLIFPAIFAIYWAVPVKWGNAKKTFLLIVSYLLYLNFNPSHSIILMGVALITYCGGYLLDCQKYNKRKSLVWLFVLLALLPLLVFKYYNFINESVSEGLSHIGLKFSLPGLNWAIPVGISFFSFQAVGYMLDVYHRRIKKEKNLLDYMLFVSFFPQIASGPISKADELLPQIKQQHKFDYSQAVTGLKYLLWGMFLKVVLADRAGIYVDTVFSEYQKFSGIGCGLASILYSIQIYADFAGYSLMAIGIAKTLGFNLINNFNRPYFSVSITDFWRRWHISLSRWLKDYVYIPMGGSRCGKLKNYWNIFVTFLVSGIWHGANWTFIIWGIIHGLCQIVEKMFGWSKKQYKGLSKAFRIILTFGIVTLAWVIFRSPSITDAFGLMSRYFTMSGTHFAGGSTLVYIFMATIPLVIYETMKEFGPKTYSSYAEKRVIRWIAYLTIFCMIVLVGVHDGSSFIYVSF